MMKGFSLQQLLDCGLEKEMAIALQPLINHPLAVLPADVCWQYLTHHVLQPNHPFALHQQLYHLVFAHWEPRQGPPPAWIPSKKQIQSTHIATLMRELRLHTYADLHAWSVRERTEFWQRMIQRLQIQFQQPYREILDLSAGVESPQWLMDAQLNIVESCFQAHAEALAIVAQVEGEPIISWTYAELLSLTNRVANSLGTAGIQSGAAIAVVMPMTAESVSIYLGIIKAGCQVVSIADSFAVNEIATRLHIAKATAVFTQDVIIRDGKELPLYTKIVAAEAPAAIVVSRSPLSVGLRSGDRTWDQFLSTNDHFTAVPSPPFAPINLLFSSGTTGEPKAIPWTQTTPIKAATDAHLHHDIHPGDVVAWPTNLGWMMGPWLIYASLINHATIALYDGSPCDRDFGRFIQDARVTMLGVVPSLVSTWRRTNCMHGLNWSTIKAFSSTGECSNPDDMLFLMALAGYKPIVEYCGGTEVGGGYLTGTLVQPCSPSTFTTPALGIDLVILDSEGHVANKGEAFIIPPSIGLSTEVLNCDHHQIYFANTPPFFVPLRRHGDQIEQLSNGYYQAQGRVDDTMNLSGIKVSTTEIEHVFNSLPEISETAAIAISPLKGGPSQLVVYVVPQYSYLSSTTLKTRLQTALKQQLNPLFKIHEVVVVEALPRTASNKVMRRVLRDRYYHEVHSTELTLDPALQHSIF